jgi:hypothetical protein
MYTIIRDSENLDAVEYDNKKDIRIRICYKRYDEWAKLYAIKKFWEEYRRLYDNSIINK